MKNRFLSVDLHKGTLLLTLVLALQITGNARAYVIKDYVDDTTTTDISKSEFTTQIIFETTVTENPAEETVITPESCNYANCHPTTAIASQLNSSTTENVHRIKVIPEDLDDTTISILITNSSNKETALDETNEIKPASTLVEDEIELIQKVDIFSSELFPNTKPINTADNEYQNNTENLEETIRNSVKNEIEVEQNISSSALLDVLQEIPELEIRKSLADEILLNQDTYSGEDKEKKTEPVKVFSTMSETNQKLVESTENKNIAVILEVKSSVQPKSIENAEYFEDNHLKNDNANLTEDIPSSVLSLQENAQISHENSTSSLPDYNREAKKLKESTTPLSNDLSFIDNNEQFQTNNHLANIKQTHIDDLHLSVTNISVAEADITSNKLLDVENFNLLERENLFEISQENESKFQDLATSQPFLVEINDDFTDMTPILAAESQEIFSIDKVTEASEYIENELEIAAVSGDNPHFITKKQGVKDIQVVENEKSETDYLDFITESLSEVNDSNAMTEEVTLNLYTKILKTDTNAVNDNLNESDIIGDDIKSTTDEMTVISPPYESMSSNNPPESVDELSEALLSHSIKDAIYPYTLYSTRHSTLILCSISALLLLFLLLTIFLKLERHHGTLNIEMQEQRCGKDHLDEEFEKCLKLLDVESSVPAPITTDESEECLQTSST